MRMLGFRYRYIGVDSSEALGCICICIGVRVQKPVIILSRLINHDFVNPGIT